MEFSEDGDCSISRDDLLTVLHKRIDEPDVLYWGMQCNRAIRIVFPSVTIKRKGKFKTYPFIKIAFLFWLWNTWRLLIKFYYISYIVNLICDNLIWQKDIAKLFKATYFCYWAYLDILAARHGNLQREIWVFLYMLLHLISYFTFYFNVFP